MADQLSSGPDDVLLDRYLAGDASESERACVNAWIEAHPLRQSVLGRLTWRSAVPTVDVERVARRIERDLGEARGSFGQTRDGVRGGVRGGVLRRQRLSGGWILRGAPLLGKQTLPRFAVRGMLGVALAGAAIFGITWSYTASSDAPAATYTTRNAHRRTITLHDGSRVSLAPGTTMRVAAGFGTRHRAVMLDGEAYFDVRSANGAPFIVRTRSIQTRVLGTRFTVQSYAADGSTRVAVLTGRVSVTSDSRRWPTLTLERGTVARASDSSVVRVTMPDVSTYASWTDGQLVFHDAPIKEVLATVGRWYDVELRLVDTTLAKRRVTAALDFGSVADLVTTLEVVLGAHSTVEQPANRRPIITLTPRRRDERVPASWRSVPIHPIPSEVGR